MEHYVFCGVEGALRFESLRFCGVEGALRFEPLGFYGVEGVLRFGTFRVCEVEKSCTLERYVVAG